MKKIITFLISVILIMNCANAHIAGDSCNFKFLLFSSNGVGWFPDAGIEITVDGIDYGFVNLLWGTSYAEEIVSLPSGEVQLFWTGGFMGSYHFEVYNPSEELIYTSPADLPGGLFFIYQNDCSNYFECLPITDFEGVYIEEENQVKLSWKAPESSDLTGFDIFRNDSLINHLTPSTTFYSDNTAELENGDYTYCVIPVYPYECDLEDECREIPISVGIKNYETHITIYPNPAKDELIITNYELEITNVELFDVLGKCHTSRVTRHENEAKVDISNLYSGIYFVKIYTKQGSVTKKVVVEP
jgi:hypothetical protein